jgi:3'(2'), 5'-bisphosphate nucleotidase
MAPSHGATVLGATLVPAVRSALLAGREILQVYRRAFAVDTKEDRTPITEADRRAHRVILEHLGAVSPYPILSEEGRDIPFEERSRWPTYWLVDPLDGTKEFVKRNDEFTVNIALMDAGGPVLGVVYAPVLEVLYFAERTRGSFKLPQPAAAAPGLLPPAGGGSAGPTGGHGAVAVSAASQGVADRVADADRPAPRDLAEALVGAAQALTRGRSLVLEEGRRYARLTVMASRSHRGPSFERYVEGLSRYAEEIHIRPLGSALKPCLVAEGVADIYPRFGPTMEWDTAAAHAILHGVGKRMVALDSGEELTYNKPELVNPSFVAL